MKLLLLTLLFLLCAFAVSAQQPASPQMPPFPSGISKDLAALRAAHYSDIHYKLELTLEKMSAMLKGTIEIRFNFAVESGGEVAQKMIILDWRPVPGAWGQSKISNVSINGLTLTDRNVREAVQVFIVEGVRLYFPDGVVNGENVIKLDFTSPIVTDGSAIKRILGIGDGSETIYSNFVPSVASTAFPMFDQPELKARFQLSVKYLDNQNKKSNVKIISNTACHPVWMDNFSNPKSEDPVFYSCDETEPISIYDFHFKAGPKL